MRKKNVLKTGLAVAAAVVVMAGCGNSTDETTAAATTAAAVEETTARETKSAEELVDEASIKLADYKGLTRTIAKVEITDDYVESELAYLASLYPVEVTGRPAKLGDVANIDYTGYDGDVAFEGGTAAGYDLTLGSGSFIDGFEDGIVGMEIGEERDLNLTFPEEYHSEDLAGKEVVFHVKLNSLASAEDSKVDDALAQRVMGDESATLELLKEDVRKDLVIQAESEYYISAGAELINQLIEKSEINLDPDAVEEMHNQMVDTYTAQAEMYGFTLEEFLSFFLQMTPESLEEYATEVVKQEMVLDEIVRLENLEITEEQKELMAEMNGFTDAAEMLELLGEESCNNVFGIGAANFYLLENSVLVEE
ncbi:MAG: trigger factor [Lachnospiraceae bacterium]|nr:trigger factor [Lachnospiraceae bacterium]